MLERATGATQVEAQIGEVVEVEVRANLGRFVASGLALYVSISYCFEVVDTNPENGTEVRPFQLGSLFAGATEAGNALLSDEQMQGMQNKAQMLSYSLVVRPGGRPAPAAARGSSPTLNCSASKPPTRRK